MSLLKYKEGILPLSDLLEADTDLSKSKINYTQSNLDVFIAELNLLKARGRLNSLAQN